VKRRPIPWVLAILLTLLLLCQACDLDRPKPDEKFYCKVDGKHWRPDNDGDFKAITLTADLTNGNKHLAINARNAKINQSIIFIMSETDSIKVNKYELSVIRSDSRLPPSAYFIKDYKADYTTSESNRGTFRILSLERDSRVPTSVIMRAEFEFTAVNPYGELVKITNGHFNGEVRIPQ
jgi:hypothetical protein